MAFKYTIFTLLALAAISLINASPTSRIIAGEDAATGQYPWVVSVRVNSVHTCVGTLISDRHILTAGHCVSEQLSQAVAASIVSVRVGSINQFSGGRIVNVQKITIYPLMSSFMHDLAILTLSQQLEFTSKIQKVDVADTDFILNANDKVNVAGWGLLTPGGSTPFKLQTATYAVESPQLCELDVGYGYDWIVCLQHDVGKGICNGDDGAGVIVDNNVVAVVSFAFGACGTQYPDIAAKTSYYSNWIYNIMDST